MVEVKVVNNDGFEVRNVIICQFNLCVQLHIFGAVLSSGRTDSP